MLVFSASHPFGPSGERWATCAAVKFGQTSTWGPCCGVRAGGATEKTVGAAQVPIGGSNDGWIREPLASSHEARFIGEGQSGALAFGR